MGFLPPVGVPLFVLEQDRLRGKVYLRRILPTKKRGKNSTRHPKADVELFADSSIS